MDHRHPKFVNARSRGGTGLGRGAVAAGEPQQREAALRFVRWITSPERAAQWGIDTGYVAVTPAAWETPRMKQYVAGFPAAAAAICAQRAARSWRSCPPVKRNFTSS